MNAWIIRLVLVGAFLIIAPQLNAHLGHHPNNGVHYFNAQKHRLVQAFRAGQLTQFEFRLLQRQLVEFRQFKIRSLQNDGFISRREDRMLRRLQRNYELDFRRAVRNSAFRQPFRNNHPPRNRPRVGFGR